MKFMITSILKKNIGKITGLSLAICFLSILPSFTVNLLTRILSQVSSTKEYAQSIPLILIYLGLYFFSNVSEKVIDYLSRLVCKKIIQEERETLSERLIHSRYDRIHPYSTGEILNAYTLLEEALFGLFYPCTQLLYFIVLLISIGVALTMLHMPTFLLIVLTVTLLIFLSKKVYKLMRRREEICFERKKDLNQYLSDLLAGYEDISINSMQSRAIEVLEQKQKSTSESQAAVVSIRQRKQKADYLILSVAIVLSMLLYVSFSEFSAAGILAIYYYINLLYSPICTLSEMHIGFAGISAKLSQVLELEKFPSDSDEFPDLPALKSLEIRNMKIGYSNTLVFKGFRMRVSNPDLIILWGESGSGKSTILNGLLGFLPVCQGDLYWNGEMLSQNQLPALRKQIGWVPQDPLLFYGTVLDNIIGNISFDKEKLYRVCFQASLGKTEKELDEILSYRPSEGGKNLSLGQVQRICVARALYRDCSLYFFDEPTSSLDQENGELILKTIENLSKRAAVIVSTHDERFLSLTEKRIRVDQLD